MKTLPPRQWLMRIFLILACLGAAPQAARADALDSFVGLYGKIEDVVGQGNLPVSADYLKQSVGYIRCIANGTDVLVCTDQYHDTGAGKDAATAAGIPTGFWMALDSYVAYKNGDYWEAAYSLGEAAVCAAIQIFTGGVDLCGIAKELYELAKGFWEGAQAVLEFLDDVGGAVLGAAEDVCKGIGLCDEDGPPLHVVLLQNVYAPKIQDGVTARESSDANAFPVLLQQLAEQAKQWFINSINTMSPGENLGQSVYEQSRQAIDAEIKQAEKGYIQAVDAAWTGDIIARVWPELAQKRANYASTKLVSLAQGAAEAYVQSAVPPSVWVRSRCVKDFVDYGMVDVWISHFPGKANEYHLTSNAEWCGSLFSTYRDNKFTDSFRQFVKSKVCPSSGAIVCNDVAGLRHCLGLLGTVDKKQECGWSITMVGKQAAQMIQDDFKARGSKIPCNIVSPLLPRALVQLQCTRPTQFAQCHKVYDDKFSNLPKLLDCSLKETEDYKALRAQVVTAANILNGQFGQGALEIDSYDPLIVLARNVSVNDVKGYPQQDWGFGPPSAQRGFEYLSLLVPPYTIDGRSTPAVWKETDAERVVKEKARPPTDVRKPSPGDLRKDLDNPVVHPLDAADRLRVPELAGRTTIPQQQQHQQQVMSGSLPSLPGLPGGLQADTSGVQQLQPTTPAPTTRPSKSACPFCPSGELQPTTPAPTIRPSLPTQAATAERPGVTTPGNRGMATAGTLPDLTYSGMPRVGGVSVGWNGSVTVDALQATKRGDLCHFPLDYEVRNGGEQNSGVVRATVANTTVPGSGWQHTLRALPPGASMTDAGTIALRAGYNSLQFVLDDNAMLAEANETNNHATLVVIVNGSCGSSLPSRQPMSDQRKLTSPGLIGR